MKSILVIVLMGSLGSFSCEKQEEFPIKKGADGVVTSMPYQWRTSLSQDGSLVKNFFEPSVIYDNQILFAGREKESSTLNMLSATTGKVLWSWGDLLEIDKDSFDPTRVYQYENYLAIQYGPRFYLIDLANGTTLQKEEREYQDASLEGIKDLYIAAGSYVLNEKGEYEGKVYGSDITSAENELLFTPNYRRELTDVNNSIGIINSAVPFVDEKSGDILITYNYSDPEPNYHGSTYAGLYNYSKKKTVYDGQPLTINVPFYGSGPAVIYQGKAYYSPAKSLICIDVYTGEQLWKRDFSEGFTFSRYIIAEGKVLANNEDTYLYALDPETGQQLWKEKSSGTSSPMAYLNGVVYFVGGGDGLLHAVEVETGKHLWKLTSPDLEVNSRAWFKRYVSVLSAEKDGEKGKVLASSYLSAFSYEAAR